MAMRNPSQHGGPGASQHMLPDHDSLSPLSWPFKQGQGDRMTVKVSIQTVILSE